MIKWKDMPLDEKREYLIGFFTAASESMVTDTIVNSIISIICLLVLLIGVLYRMPNITVIGFVGILIVQIIALKKALQLHKRSKKLLKVAEQRWDETEQVKPV